MRGLISGWRVSLRRTRADWPIVAAALLITMLATMLFAAGPIYSSAAALAGLRRTLDDAPTADTNVEVSVYAPPAYLAGVDNQVQSDLRGALAPLPAPVVRDARNAATLAIPDGPNGAPADRAIVGFLDDLPAHARLVAGVWPTSSAGAGQAAPGAPLDVALVDAAAAAIPLNIGDQVLLGASAKGPSAGVAIRLVGTFAPNDPADPYWYGDDQLTTGISGTGKNRTIGPFMTTPEGILQNASMTSVHMRWRVLPDFDPLTVDEVAGIHARLDALPARLPQTSTISATLATGLPDILGGAERSLLVSRTEVLLLMAQLALMAAYAIVLTASLLVEHRRVETSLLRSRGAGAGHIAWLAFAEGLLLVVPAVVLAPYLAVGLSSVLDIAGPLADIGLKTRPAVTSDSVALAALAGVICLALLVLPAFLAARNFASEERELSRQETRTFGQRMGLDIVLLAVSLIALWQLRLYGAPLTQTVQGSLGFDPLLVAAPALGLLAGGILALRVMPLLAQIFERWISRGREIVGSLGSRQLARRPLRYTRTALLLMLALSLGVFALSYSATWGSSQRDQAAYQAGADVRASVVRGAGVALAVPAAYAGLAGVTATTPAERISDAVALAKGNVDLLALDADTASSVVKFRPDEATQPLGELMAALRAGRPTPEMVTLPADAQALQIDTLVEISSIDKIPVFDPLAQPTPLDPMTLTGVNVTATAIVRDAHGLTYRLTSAATPIATGDSHALVNLPLSPGGAAAAALDGPLQLAAVGFDLTLPNNTVTMAARIGITGLATSAAGPVDPSGTTTLPTTGWSTRMAVGRAAPKPVPAQYVEGMVVTTGDNPTSFLDGAAPAARFLYTTPAIDTLSGDLPVVSNAAFLAATGSAVGQTIDLTLDGARRTFSITGSVDSFPTTDPTQPLLIVDEPTLGLFRLQATGASRNVDEWWLATQPDESAAVSDAVRAAPFNSPEVISTQERSRSLSTDPVALGIIGALLLGFVATGMFALVALVVSAAVSARQRRTEFALLRALGLSGRQLSNWLWLENASLVLVSLIAGTIIGAVISWIALPFITVTQQATAPVPGVVVYLPWDRILMLDLVVVVALGIAVAILAAALRRLGVGSILRLGSD